MERKYFKSLTDDERRLLKKKIFQHLNIPDQEKVRSMHRWKRKLTISIAASVIALMGLLTLLSNPHSKEKLLLARTSAGEIKQVMLADSSIVILNPGSSLYSVSDFSTANREVFLEGNGFFNVRKLVSGQQFVVRANAFQVTVLGTRFNVNATDQKTEVALTHGKVKVTYDGGKQPAAFMVPGDKMELDRSTGEMHKSQMDPSLYSPWINGEWNFRNTSLADIASLISDYYGVEVSFANETSKNLRITAIIPVTTLKGIVNVIDETLPVKITVNNQQLFIQ